MLSSSCISNVSQVMIALHYISISLILLSTISKADKDIFLPGDILFQSGADYGNSYGSSIKIDPYHNRLFVTGTTYGNFWDDNDGGDFDPTSELPTTSRCFLGIYDWTTKAWTKKTFRNKNPSRSQRERIIESCRKMEIVNNGTKVLLLGYTQANGILNDFVDLSSIVQPVQYGMILDIDIVEKDATTTSIDLIGGRLLQDGTVQYPIDMVLIPNEMGIPNEMNMHMNNLFANDLYVVSMQSYDEVDESDSPDNSIIKYSQPHNSEQQILTPNYNQKSNFQYGSISSLLAERFFYVPDEANTGGGIVETYTDIWRELYGTEYLENTVDVVGVVAPDTEHLIVIGNTAEIGSLFGKPSVVYGSPPKNRDGFITVLSPKTGKQIQEGFGDTEATSVRIGSENYMDDEITGYCNDENHLYLVGTTKGKIVGPNSSNDGNATLYENIHAFIVSVNLKTLAIEWTNQVISNTTVHGVACSSSSDKNGNPTVYWGGNIYDGGSLILDNTGDKIAQSLGGDDIFFSELSAIDGALLHLRQWGTNHDDALSDMQSDHNGNIVVMGTTDGGTFRHPVSKDKQSCVDGKLTDIFFFTLDKEDIEKQFLDENSNNSDIIFDPCDFDENTNNEVELDDPDLPVKLDDPDLPRKFKDPDLPIIASNTTERKSFVLHGLYYIFIFLWYIFLVFFFSSIIIYVCTKVCFCRNSRDSLTNRDNITKYLQDFEIGDIDMRNSATGGWHGSYLNDLAEGINTMDSNPGWQRRKPLNTNDDNSSAILRNNNQLELETSLTDLESSLVGDSKTRTTTSYKDDHFEDEHDLGGLNDIALDPNIHTDLYNDAHISEVDHLSDWKVDDTVVNDYYMSDHNVTSSTDPKPGSNAENIKDKVSDII